MKEAIQQDHVLDAQAAFSPKRLTLWAGLTGLYIFAAGGWLLEVGIELGFVLMLVAFLLNVRDVWPRLRERAVFYICAAFGAYIVARAGVALWEYPHAVDALWNGLMASLAISGVGSLVVASWLAGDEGRIRWSLMLACTGLVLGLLVNLHWENIEAYMNGQRMTRVSLGANGAGLYSMSAIIGIIALAVPAILRHRDRAQRYLLGLLCVIALFVLATAFLWNQARQAWLAAAIVLPVVLAGTIRTTRSRAVTVGSLSFLAVFVLVGIANSDLVAKRLSHVDELIVSMVNLDTEEVAGTSVDHRVQIWREGIRRIEQRPLFGWGPGMAPVLSKESGGVYYEHFHNIFIHVWAELGLVGLLLFVAAWAAMLRELYRAYREGSATPRYVLFVAGVVGLFTIVTSVDMRHDDVHGMFYVTSLGALALAYRFREAREPPKVRARG
ncbi:MAG: O-antigen ligase family protein [Gammaproteobacteria bacterium]|nr:O-antigen ligase family protein [Gammaproteobacteria bacterium]NIR81912.1 O-antigen ligase family protein [Gammaproteobacteria bacterium]NIR88744.1 O-antigen ligase family protein [Gammaproteobacteria bacterium]NIU03020.1 O-antigen ligase family protein [Gammaproteobacteria bacterium]NIV50541.1 hypothetical protein [Gammaproteobacteria bacterium]